MALFKPQQNYILVELDRMETTSPSGLIELPYEAQSRPQLGTVRATGPGRFSKKGKLIPVELKSGDRVYVPWAKGNDILLDGRPYLLIRESDILAIAEESI